MEKENFIIEIDGINKKAKALNIVTIDGKRYLIYSVDNNDNIEIYSSEIVIDTNGTEKLVDIETESVRQKILEIIEKMFE
ncbi:MAG: hypothetical protein BHW38_06475 [Firmicutes bacterium CAG:321_26_22]|nr:MAG: hypothetical protein BHW38_06475 [Firmicutes bacterium CAG:321_26_22]